jgi:hypothetical protein
MAADLHPDGLADLRKSGLTDDSITRCGLSTVCPEVLKKLGAKYRDVLQATEIIYFHLDDSSPRDYSRLKLFWRRGRARARTGGPATGSLRVPPSRCIYMTASIQT